MLAISTATADEVQQSIRAINGDLSKIKDAQGDLSDERRQQVQAANKTFTSQVQSILSSLGKSTSLSDASSRLTSATQELATAYQRSFARIDCS
jgi:HAMP domain-containing protein